MDHGIFDGIPEVEYHDHPFISQSGLNTLLDCPARFEFEHEFGRKVGAAADFGTLVHSILLSDGAGIQIAEFNDWRTNAAKEFRASVAASGQLAVLEKDYAKAEACAEAVEAHPMAGALLGADGGTEQSMFWQRPVGGRDVNLRGRVDKVAVDTEGTTLVDLKTTASASPRAFVSSVLRYGYHVQQAAYTDGWERLTQDSPNFLFVVVEPEPPFLTAVYRLDDDLAAYGRERYDNALDIYVRCLDSGVWPGYGEAEGVMTLEAPGWLATTRASDDIW